MFTCWMNELKLLEVEFVFCTLCTGTLVECRIEEVWRHFSCRMNDLEK